MIMLFIVQVNNRALYYFALADYKNAEKDFHLTTRGLELLQGWDHPDTIGSIANTVKMFKEKGITFNAKKTT